MQFGEFIKQKRLEKGINLRRLAEMAQIAPAYLSDIEKGKRNSPSPDKMEKLAAILELSPDEITLINDLAAQDRNNTVASDISEYVSQNQSVRVALRKARELNLSDKDWLRIIEEMEKSDDAE